MSAVRTMRRQGLSIREFARQDGCDDKLVRRAITSGKLKLFTDGSLDPELVGTGWRKSNRRRGQSADSLLPSSQKSAKSPQQSDGADALGSDQEFDDAAAQGARAFIERVISSGTAPYTQAEAERVKENYLALLRQLEYDTKAGAVVMVAEVAKAVGQEYAKVRTRLIALPSELAPRIGRLKDVNEIREELDKAVREALEELSFDGGDADTN